MVKKEQKVELPRLSTKKIVRDERQMQEDCHECKRMKWTCVKDCPWKTGVWK